MLQPQSDDEVRPVVEALRRLDPLLDIRWNPKAVMVQRGAYDVLGGRLDPKYDGRWEVIRYETPNLHDDRPYAVITRVTETVTCGEGTRQYRSMLLDGAYAPVGLWLVEYMQLWDRAQSAWVEASAQAWADHEAIETLNHEDDRAAHQEGLERVYREHGGAYWMGGAQGKASAEAERLLFGTLSQKGRRSIDTPADTTTT